MTDERYWANRCRLAEDILEADRCYPTVASELIDAWKEYHLFIKENGTKEY